MTYEDAWRCIGWLDLLLECDEIVLKAILIVEALHRIQSLQFPLDIHVAWNIVGHVLVLLNLREVLADLLKLPKVDQGFARGQHHHIVFLLHLRDARLIVRF